MPVKIVIALLLSVLVIFQSNAQKKNIDFIDKWIEIDSLVTSNNLTQRALQKVNELYTIAKNQQLDVQIIKCLVYKLSLEDVVFDNKPNNGINILQKEIAQTNNQAATSILYSLLANRYLHYFNNNRWKFYNGSKTINFKSEDIETWGADNFGAAISKNFEKSIINFKFLQTVRLDEFEAIVSKGNARYLRPTLFDLLAHEALDYFKTGDYYLTKPTFVFELKDTIALSDFNTFVKASFTTVDTASHLIKSLQLFQKLLQFHNNDLDKNALVDVDLERIEWVNQNLIGDKSTAYLKALNYVKAIPTARTAQAYYLQANYYVEKANTYQPFGDTTYRFENITAMQIIAEGLANYKQDDEGVSNLKNLQQQILQKSIITQTEEVNIPNKSFRALVGFKNIDTLFVRIIKLSSKFNLSDNWQNTDFDELAAMPVFKSFAQPLPTTKDYQVHNVEIKLDALPVGRYVLLTSSGAAFIDTLDKMSKQLLQVSNISYIKNGNDYFVLNRETGVPLANVKITITKTEWNKTRKKTETITVAIKTTNINGYFNFIPKDEYGNYQFEFIAKNDLLNLESNEYIYKSGTNDDDDDYGKDEANDYEDDKTKIYFFTDRSIYRPGQTIYFKGIAITKDFKTKQSKVLANKDSVLVFLKDANNNNIDSLYLKTNTYGSFSGKFIIPQNVLTGSFSVNANGYSSDKSFLVEEYKRPMFYVEFESLKGTYRLNDSITVTGFAKSYAGNVIDGAKVKFNVQRNARFVYDWLWRSGSRPYSRNQQIANGDIVTDVNGKFTIIFKALPDEKVNAATEPIFDFTVSADVTDINGETRSANKEVSVGNKNLVLTIAVPKLAEADSLKQITITTKNMNGENEAAIATIKVYAVQTPQRLIRKRLWQQADMFVMDKLTYLQYFPNDDYTDELNENTWLANNLVFEGNINTATNTKFQIPNSKLTAGFYKIEATTTDKDGNSIKDIKFLQLFNRSVTPYPQYNFNYTLNNYVEPNETATFVSGSMAEKTFVISKISRPKLANKERATYQFNNYQKGLHNVIYKADETDRGNVAISEAFVINNRVYTNQYNIIVPFSNKALNISYTSFRNKTEPGSKETWTVNIAGNKGEKVAAELLTSMYDASLDQFKKHEWVQPRIWTENQYKNDFMSRSGFETVRSNENNNENIIKLTPTIYDAFLKFNSLRKMSLFNSEQYLLAGKVSGIQISNKYAEDDLVVVGYGTRKSNVVASIATVTTEALNHEQAVVRIRAVSGIADENSLLVVIDGVVSALKFKDVDMELVDHIDIIKSSQALVLYGTKAVNGALVVTTKDGKRNKQKEKPIQPRKNFNETAFFFPNLYADTSGNYSFSFTMPEALTQWKWQSFVHTKDLAFGTNTAIITTQKTLMVQTNAPRFVREGDNIELVTKISNLSDKELTGQVVLELVDVSTNTSVDGWFQNMFPVQYFTVAAGQSTAVKFPLSIPFSYNKPLMWRVVAKAGKFSDGEENILPVLSNRMLVTESLPLLIKGDTTQHFTFDKLLNNNSETLTNQSLTVEYTANPIWAAVQALPYLMEYPYECAEQTFNRFYANALAAHIVAKHPSIKLVFDKWKMDTTLFKSNLSKNEELKQVLLQETPWVLQAENEVQQQKNIALLFDVVMTSEGSNTAIEKLKQMQLESGGFAWFKGGKEDRYITNYIVTGIGKLKKLNALPNTTENKLQPIINKALAYLDNSLKDDYASLIKSKVDTFKNQLSSTQIQYLYTKSFFINDIKNSEAYNYYYKQAKQFWVKQNLYHQALLGLAFSRNGELNFTLKNILPSIIENTINNEKGMYWKEAYTYFWYQNAVEFESLMIGFLSEINQQKSDTLITKSIADAKTWLLLNKQTNNWKTTVATADACYALFSNEVLNTNKQVKIQLGNYNINSSKQTTQTGTGYFKTNIDGNKVIPEMGNVIVTTSSTKQPINQSAISYGSLYWQYFEDFEKITASASPLSITKKLFVEINSNTGKILKPVNENDELKIGDKVIIRLELRADRDIDYVHLKDTRAATMEPANVLSEYKYQDGLGYYEATKDASTNFFFSSINKGTYVFEYPVFITHVGTFSIGIANLQCMYAPEFTSHSQGFKISVKSEN